MKPFKILIVEDDPIHGKIIQHILENIEHDIILLRSNNGFDALKIVEEEFPDLILTDWDMPKMTGIEFCKKIQLKKELARIPVIMWTRINT